MTDGAAVPMNDYLVPTAEERPAVESLKQQTHYLYGDHILTYAIRNGRKDQLLQEHDQLLYRNNFDYLLDEDGEKTDQLDTSLFAAALECATDGEGFGPVPPRASYRLWVMMLIGNQFVATEKSIEYGNCQECYRAMPLGIPCNHCPYSRGQMLYFKDSRIHLGPGLNLQRLAGHPALPGYRQRAVPVETAQLLGRAGDTILIADWIDLEQRGWTPHHDEAWTQCNVLWYLEAMEAQGKLHSHDYLEQQLSRVLGCTKRDIRPDVDLIIEKFNAEERQMIMERRTREDEEEEAAARAAEAERAARDAAIRADPNYVESEDEFWE